MAEGGIQVSVSKLKGVDQILSATEMSEALGEQLFLAAQQIGQLAEFEVVQQLAGVRLQVRSSVLKGSVGHLVRNEEDQLVVAVGNQRDVPYAAIQEFGGTIVPVNKDWLTIPLPAAKTASGVARGPALSFENTFFHRNKENRLFLLQDQGPDRAPVYLFELVKQVEIPESNWLSGPIDELEERGEIEDLWVGAIARFVESVDGGS